MKIGIDIGNVIIGGDGSDTQFFTEQFLDTPPVPGVKQSLYDLWMNDHELHYISKCGTRVEAKTIDWLNHWAFTPSYIMVSHRIHFVRKRELKAPMAQAFELDIFIDDRQDVLDHMIGVVPHCILFTSWEQTNKELQEIFDQQKGVK